MYLSTLIALAFFQFNTKKDFTEVIFMKISVKTKIKEPISYNLLINSSAFTFVIYRVSVHIANAIFNKRMK